VNSKKNEDLLTADIEEMIVRIAKKYKIIGMDLEDKISEIRSHLKSKIPKYKSEKGQFRVWALRVLKNKLLDLMREFGKEPEVISFSEMPIKILRDDTRISFEETLEATDKGQAARKTNFEFDVKLILSRLSPKDKLVFKMKIDGYDLEEITEKTGVKRETIKKRWNRRLPFLKKSFRKYLK